MDRNPRRRTGGLASLLPAMLLLAVMGTASAGGSAASSQDAAPVVDLTVRHPGR